MKSKIHPHCELLAPAGNWDCARAAVANGADAIYFGLPAFNARMRADNFSLEELPKLIAFLHEHGVKGYVTFNTLIFANELKDAESMLRQIDASGADAIIVQDMGLARLARAVVPGLGLHASTQMTITSPEGLAFVDDAFHLDKAVIARENSLREIHLFHSKPGSVPLETFVHGALCVAYSGQCLTSESLGQRSANRGECAQACRMTYALVVDGEERDLGDKRYLLSPQDLAGVDLIPQLIEAGVQSFKIEGRLKSPEYVAAVTSVYRKAIDRVLEGGADQASAKDHYRLEMTFSRGLYSGWLEGINNQKLVHARFGKKRGAFVGEIERMGRDWVSLSALKIEVHKGDGVVIDTGGDTDQEQGGRVFDIQGSRIFFQRGKIDTNRVRVGDRIWKTDDPALTRELQASWNGKKIEERRQRGALHWKVAGRAGEAMVLKDVSSNLAIESSMVLSPATSQPLTRDFLFEKLSRLGQTGFVLASLDTDEMEEGLILPVSEINRMRRDLAEKLSNRAAVPPERLMASSLRLEDLLPAKGEVKEVAHPLRVLCRSEEQIEAALDCGIEQIYIDLEDVRRYRPVVASLRDRCSARLFLATPRIQKAGESGLFRVVANAKPDGVLVRNLGGIPWFREESDLSLVGDFSLNIANPVAADFFMSHGFENLTVSYDLNLQQVLDLLSQVPSHWFELTLHQHMPMFHMEHCVFCAFLSEGTDSTNCGRPCDKHQVKLRDRVGQHHLLKADVGCRNTLFNGRAQSGARYLEPLREAGLKAWRVELLNESREEGQVIIRAYQELLAGKSSGEEVWRRLKTDSKLGVVEGTLG